MNLRALSGRRLAVVLAVAAAVAVAAVAAVAASGGGGATPPAEALPTAIHDALAAQAPAGITARVRFTNKLFPSGALAGQAGSPLMASATGRVWASADGGRLELQSDAGDAQIVWNDSKVTVYDATSNTAYVADLPKSTAPAGAKHAVPSIDEITKLLGEAANNWTVSGAQPDNVAGQPAYTVQVSPKHDGGLLGSAQLAWDAARGVPLKIAVYAQGSSSPALALEATDISFGSVPASTIDVAPPAGAKIVNLSSQSHGKDAGSAPVTGLDAVKNAAPWAVVPDTLVGLPRQDVRLVGSADSRAVLAIYGQGLGAILVVERQKGAAKGAAGPLDALPSVSLDGITAHELDTQLGTVLTWDEAGVSYVLAGSVPPAAAEAAARALR